MTDDTSGSLRVVPDLEERTVRRLAAVVVGLAGLLALLGLAALLPAADRILAAITPRPVALLVAVATVLVVAALLVAAPAVRVLVTGGLGGPEPLVEDAAAAAEYLVGFVVVVLAYRGLAGVVVPVLAAFDLDGVYHLAFLVAGVVTLGALARRLYGCWGPVTTLVAAYVTSAFDNNGTHTPSEK